ncbi:hypothetical protein EON80_33175 [bacterium]|nr:MAG: hypothetical protein EON80_33175 [bacterium]
MMPFSMTHRAASLRGLFLFGAGLVSTQAKAQELSARPTWTLGTVSAPTFESDAPVVDSSTLPLKIKPRATRPTFAARLLSTISAPPDGFYQTPAQLEPWMFELAKSRPSQVATRVIGKTPGGRHIVALEVVPAGVSPWKMKRLVVLCRQHGNEPEASASGMRFIREFLTTTDPSEVGILTKWIGTWKPHMVVDVHQWLPNERQPPPMAEASGGVLARQTAQRMAQNSASRGYALAARSRWGLDTLSHRYWGQRFHIPAILLESRHRPSVQGARDVAIGTSLAALWGAVEMVAK